MSDRVKHKSRATERSAVVGRGKKKKKSKKRSTSSSDDCVIVTSKKNPCAKEKRRKSRGKKRRRSSSGDSSTSESSVVRLKLGDKPKQLLGERPEFCRNRAKLAPNSVSTETFRSSRLSHASQTRERRNDPLSGAHLSMIERRVLGSLLEERARRAAVKDRLDASSNAKKSKKSRKRRRSSTRSSSISDSSTSQSSSPSDSSSVSSTSSSSGASSERRRKRRKRKKKKLAKKMMKREEKKRKEERRKLKRIMKEKSRATAEEMKREIIKAPQDRLLKDINVELADRARAMAPMTREQWEKRQSVVRRVYDEETGRQRLIKGDGEVLEEIVSRDRHMAINRKATKGDGEFFQSRLRVNK